VWAWYNTVGRSDLDPRSKTVFARPRVTIINLFSRFDYENDVLRGSVNGQMAIFDPLQNPPSPVKQSPKICLVTASLIHAVVQNLEQIYLRAF